MPDQQAPASARDRVIVFSESPFVAAVHHPERRESNGDLRNPTRLYVACYSMQQDVTTLRPVDWLVAETLAPEALHRLGKRLATHDPTKA